jgi:hypothetical protein
MDDTTQTLGTARMVIRTAKGVPENFSVHNQACQSSLPACWKCFDGDLSSRSGQHVNVRIQTCKYQLGILWSLQTLVALDLNLSESHQHHAIAQSRFL